MSSGSKTYVYRKIEGRPIRYKLGRVSDLDIKHASIEARKIIGKMASGENPHQEKIIRKSEPTMQDVFIDFLNNRAIPGHRSWKEEQRKYEVYLSTWKNKKLSTIHNSDVLLHFRKIGTDHGLVQANRVLTLLKNSF